MSALSGEAGAAPVRRRLPWKRAIGSIVGIAVIVWLLSDQDLGPMWQAAREVEPTVLLLGVPLILANMMLRAARWRPLLGSAREVPYWPVFSALMVGYLANTFLPARGGDLVRIYVLGNEGLLSRSRILATVLVERVLDMAAMILVLALVATASPLPDWVRQGATMLGAAAALGIAGLIGFSQVGERVVGFLLRPVAVRAPALAERLGTMAGEFAVGVQCFRKRSVALIFFSASAVIWLLEIMLVLLVAWAFGLGLGAFDGAVLMLFSLFSSLIPALPGQIGTFELAMVTGLGFIGEAGPAALPFALTLHLLLLGGTSLIGLVCLFVSSGSLLPPAAGPASSSGLHRAGRPLMRRRLAEGDTGTPAQ
jgi:glycosyltransferase 2 family protein